MLETGPSESVTPAVMVCVEPLEIGLLAYDIVTLRSAAVWELVLVLVLVMVVPDDRFQDVTG